MRPDIPTRALERSRSLEPIEPRTARALQSGDVSRARRALMQTWADLLTTVAALREAA